MLGKPGTLMTDSGLRLADFAICAEAINTFALGDAATAYAEIGIPVFPCEPNGKRPHPKLPKRDLKAGGLHLAHTDPNRIEKWWAEYPDSNIGLRTGEVFDVLDVDMKHDAPGWQSVSRLNAHGLLAGAFAQASTPSGGGHLLFAPSGHGNHSAGKSGHGLDFRGVGGYVVAAPSVIDGACYQWVALKPEQYGATLVWDSLTDVLVEPRAALAPRSKDHPRSIEGLVRTVASAQPGNRNSTLYWSARRCAEGGVDPILLLPAALSVGLSEWEGRSTIGSAARCGTNQ